MTVRKMWKKRASTSLISFKLNDATKTAREVYDQMLELYPDRANPGSLWSSAAAAKAET